MGEAAAGLCNCACHQTNPNVQVAHAVPCCYPPVEAGPLLTDLLERQRRANPMAGRWVDLDDHGQKVVLDWLIGTCLTFGASIGTAYQVAGLFASGLDRDALKNGSSAASAADPVGRAPGVHGTPPASPRCDEQHGGQQQKGNGDGGPVSEGQDDHRTRGAGQHPGHQEQRHDTNGPHDTEGRAR